MRWGTPIAALLTTALGCAPAARADEPSPDQRADVEWALLSGRVADLPGARPKVDPTSAMFGWRDGTGTAVRVGSLQVLHAAFARDAAGYPVVMALLRDRDERELGWHAVWDPEQSPLAKLPDPDGRIRWFLAQSAAVHDPVRDEDSPDPNVSGPARARIARAHELRSGAARWALIALGALVVLALAAGLLVRPRSKEP